MLLISLNLTYFFLRNSIFHLNIAKFLFIIFRPIASKGGDSTLLHVQNLQLLFLCFLLRQAFLQLLPPPLKILPVIF